MTIYQGGARRGTSLYSRHSPPRVLQVCWQSYRHKCICLVVRHGATSSIPIGPCPSLRSRMPSSLSTPPSSSLSLRRVFMFRLHSALGWHVLSAPLSICLRLRLLVHPIHLCRRLLVHACDPLITCPLLAYSAVTPQQLSLHPMYLSTPAPACSPY